MAYTSIFSGGQLGSVNQNLLTYKAPAPIPQKVDPNSFKDIPSLNAAVRAGTISKQAGLIRLKQLIPQSPAPPSSFLGKIKTYGPSSLGTALNQTLVKDPIAIAKSVPQSEKTVAQVVARVLPGGQNDIKAENQATAQSLKNLQQINTLRNSGRISNAAASRITKSIQQDQQTNAQNIKTTAKSIPTRGQAAAGVLGTAADILTGGTLPELKGAATAARLANAGGRAIAFGTDAGLATGAAGGTKKQIIKNAVIGAGLPLAGEGLSKAIGKGTEGAKTVVGKNQGVKDLINNSRAQNLADTLERTKQSVPIPRSALDNHTVEAEPSPSLPKSPAETVPPVADKNISNSLGQGSGTKSEQTFNTGSKISGSALNSEQRAIAARIVDKFPDKATYESGSNKVEAANAARLVTENPDEAKAIALGQKPGNNEAHEVLVRRAVEDKATQENDANTILKLGNSSQHTSTSKAAQRLSAEGFAAERNSPVRAIREISQAREKAVIGKGDKATKAVSSTVKDIRSSTEPKLKVSRQDWDSFIQELKC